MILAVDKMVTTKHGYVSTKELFDTLCDKPQWSFTPSEVMLVVAQLNIVPTVDAEPVKHGKWEDGKCSVCGERYWHCEVIDFNYCPNCGAKMDEVTE